MAVPWQIPTPEFDRFANAVAEAIPTVVARIPARPAATMGRMAVADSPIG